MGRMSVMSAGKRRARRSFTPEFKAEIVELARVGERSVGELARDFDLTETSIRAWMAQAERDGAAGPNGALSGDERAELARLQRENARLRQDVDILKRATAFFASETR